MTDTRPDPISAYDRLGWSDDTVQTMLARGEHRRELVAMFGSDLHATLTTLARRAAQAVQPGAARVWLLPGIMGSRLGRLRAAGEPADTLWLDPLDVIDGRLRELALDGPGADVHSLGMLQYSYLQFKLQLSAAGHDVRVFDYDWRRGVAELSAQFAAAMRDDARPASIVAHSMGGIVARHALTHGQLPSISHLVLLGTPNKGAWATVMALRGSYSVVRRLAQLDRVHDATSLAANVFHSFRSLYDLMPNSSSTGQPLRSLSGWPLRGLRPPAQGLEAATGIDAPMPAPTTDCSCIVGYGKPTVIDAEVADEFTYQIANSGDGTVATSSASLPGAACYYASSGHSDLMRDAAIAEAVVDILATGSTRRLATTEPVCGAGWQLTDSQLHALGGGKLDWASMSIDERRIFLDSLNEGLPPPP